MKLRYRFLAKVIALLVALLPPGSYALPGGMRLEVR